jgi:hypothetical protein
MLLHNDIQPFFCSNGFTLSKKKNAIMYIIEFRKEIYSNDFIWTKFQ